MLALICSNVFWCTAPASLQGWKEIEAPITFFSHKMAFLKALSKYVYDNNLILSVAVPVIQPTR
jgi:hypothetical protein